MVLMAGPVSWRRLPGMLWWLGAATAVVLLLGLFVLLRERTLRKLVIEHEGRVCPGCTYPLPGQEGQVRCPECGQTVDLERTIEQWRQFTAW